MTSAERISKLAARMGKLQIDLRGEGLSDIADMIKPAALKIVSVGLEAYEAERVSANPPTDDAPPELYRANQKEKCHP